MNHLEFSFLYSQVKLLKITQLKQFIVKGKQTLKIYVKLEKLILSDQGTLIRSVHIIQTAKELL